MGKDEGTEGEMRREGVALGLLKNCGY